MNLLLLTFWFSLSVLHLDLYFNQTESTFNFQWSRESIHLNKYRETQREQIKEPQMCLCCLSLSQNKHQLADSWVPWVSSVGREGSTQKIKPSSYIVFFLPVAAVFVDSTPLSTNSLSFLQLLHSLNFPLHIQIRVQHWIYQTWAKICLMITLSFWSFSVNTLPTFVSSFSFPS